MKLYRVKTLINLVEAFEWKFAREQRAAIDLHWESQSAQRPTLFDGRIMMTHHVSIDPNHGGSLRTKHFEASYRSFLAWRDFGYPDPDVRNIFSMCALRSADGAFIIGEMADHTANAGKAYFPAGMLDAQDVLGRRVDLAKSAARELLEETGLNIIDAKVDSEWSIIAHGPSVACIRLVAFDRTADELMAQISGSLAGQDQPEFVRMYAVRSMTDLQKLNTPDFIQFYLATEFAPSTAFDQRRDLDG